MERKHSFSLKNIVKMVIGVILIASICFLAIFALNQNKEAEYDGNITIVCNDINNNPVSSKRVSFKKGDNLFDIVLKAYNLKYDDTQYGHFLTGISDDTFKIETDIYNTFIWLEVAHLNEGETYSDVIDFSKYHEVPVQTGIDGIEVVDNMILGINECDNNHKTTMFKDVIDNSTKENNMAKIIFIATAVIALLLVLGYIIYLSIRDFRIGERLSVKDIALIAFLTCLLFLQEELLTFLPNIQLTFFLIILYSKKLGIKKTSLIILIHVILDNVFMASFSVVFVLPMLVGYLLIPLTINTIFKRVSSDFGLALLAIAYAFIYCWLFIIPSVLILEIPFESYFYADIIFEALLALSSFTSVWLLYNPCSYAFDEIKNL